MSPSSSDWELPVAGTVRETGDCGRAKAGREHRYQTVVVWWSCETRTDQPTASLFSLPPPRRVIAPCRHRLSASESTSTTSTSSPRRAGGPRIQHRSLVPPLYLRARQAFDELVPPRAYGARRRARGLRAARRRAAHLHSAPLLEPHRERPRGDTALRPAPSNGFRRGLVAGRHPSGSSARTLLPSPSSLLGATSAASRSCSASVGTT